MITEGFGLVQILLALAGSMLLTLIVFVGLVVRDRQRQNEK